MSIAVSAVIQPSRILLLLVGGMCLILLGIAGVLVIDAIGNLALLERIILAGICAAMAISAFSRAMLRKKKYVIHISGTGQIRLAAAGENDQVVEDSVESELVQLLPVSTIWSSLLILHLQNKRQQTTIVTILPDAVSTESFRALLVACRWIILRHADTTSDIRH